MVAANDTQGYLETGPCIENMVVHDSFAGYCMKQTDNYNDYTLELWKRISVL